MPVDRASLCVPIDGFVMQLRRYELESVAAGLGEFGVSAADNLITLAAALRSLPSNERAPVWELAVRRYGRRKPAEQAAAEIGMDAIRANVLFDALSRAVTAVALPEATPGPL